MEHSRRFEPNITRNVRELRKLFQYYRAYWEIKLDRLRLNLPSTQRSSMKFSLNCGNTLFTPTLVLLFSGVACTSASM